MSLIRNCFADCSVNQLQAIFSSNMPANVAISMIALANRLK